jgi:DNA-binding response OmpR family regulator
VLQDEETAFGLGAADYIAKPISRNELLQRMERLCAISAENSISDILVIDDDKDFVDTLVTVLEGESFTVDRAYTGLQGIELASRERPDLVFLDLMLPDISGFEIVEFLKMNDSTKDIPIIILTGKDLTEEEKSLLNGKVEASARKGRHDKHDFLSEIKKVERLAAAKKGEG